MIHEYLQNIFIYPFFAFMQFLIENYHHFHNNIMFKLTIVEKEKLLTIIITL
jgi:hypothetical protein